VGGIEVAGVVGCRAGSGGERRRRCGAVRVCGVTLGLELRAKGGLRGSFIPVPLHSDFRGLRNAETQTICYKPVHASKKKNHDDRSKLLPFHSNLRSRHD
jgi:hypothetical protein